MELRDYVAIVGRYKWLFWGIVIVVALLIGMYTARQPVRYEGSVTLYVSQTAPTTADANTVQYGNFYNIQGAGLYAGELKTFIDDPAFVAKTFASVNEPLPDVRLTALSQVFVAKVDPAGQLQITFDDANRTRVEHLLNAAATQLTAETATIQQAGGAPDIVLIHDQPYIQSYQSSVVLSTIVAAVVAAAFAITLILLIDLSRPKSKQ